MVRHWRESSKKKRKKAENYMAKRKRLKKRARMGVIDGKIAWVNGVLCSEVKETEEMCSGWTALHGVERIPKPGSSAVEPGPPREKKKIDYYSRERRSYSGRSYSYGF